MNRTERLDQDEAVDPILFYRQQDEWGQFSNFSRGYSQDQLERFRQRVRQRLYDALYHTEVPRSE